MGLSGAWHQFRSRFNKWNASAIADELATKRLVLGRMAEDPLTQDFVTHTASSTDRARDGLLKPLFEVVAIHRFYDAVSAALNIGEGLIPNAGDVAGPVLPTREKIPVLSGSKHIEKVEFLPKWDLLSDATFRWPTSPTFMSSS